MHNCSKPPQARILPTLWFLLLACSLSPLQAAPYLPASAEEIVETIPDYIAAKPVSRDLASSIALASELLSRAKQQSDPRAVNVALSLLEPWAGTQSADLNLARAGLLQYQHKFASALNQLDMLISNSSPDPRALILRANIYIVQGHYSMAEEDCAALLRISDTALSATCISIVHSLSGKLDNSYAALTSFSERFTESDPTIQQWMAASLAEMAVRIGKDPQEHWTRALELSPDNIPLLLEKSRWLIDNRQANAAKAILETLPSSLSRDVLLARISRSDDAAKMRSRLALAELADGENAHAREYTEFLLYVVSDPDAAAEKALVNWRQQREPIDLLLLSQAAEQSGNQAARQAARSFRINTNIEDVRLPAFEPES